MSDPENNKDETKQPESLDTAGKKEELSAEEQMAAFEENLKESDWGHQPC
jgi:hypothetical protein